MTETVQFKDGRYKVTLPWKDSHPVLPDNYQLSPHRLQGLLRRLRQDTNVLQEYDSVIKTQIQQGIVDSVEHPELSSSSLSAAPRCRPKRKGHNQVESSL